MKALALGTEAVNGGRDQARWVEDSDPDGSRVVHLRVDTQRQIDRLSAAGRINPEQHMAGTTLRNDWEFAGWAMGHLKASKLEIVGHSVTEELASMGAYEEYKLAMAQVARDDRSLLQNVVIFDHDLDAWARKWRCDGNSFLRRCLDKLTWHYERVRR